MDSIIVRGNGPLKGTIPIAGAKNACLTLMPATLLSEEPLTLTNAPRLSDIRTMTELLSSLGAEVSALQDGKVLAMSSMISTITSRIMTSCARCAPRTLFWGRCWRGWVRRLYRCRGAVRSGRGRWTCMKRGLWRWAQRSSLRKAIFMPRRPKALRGR